MWLRRYSLRMFDSEVYFYYRNHPRVVQLSGHTNKKAAHLFAFNRKLWLSNVNVNSEETNEAPEISFDSRQVFFYSMIIPIM